MTRTSTKKLAQILAVAFLAGLCPILVLVKWTLPVCAADGAYTGAACLPAGDPAIQHLYPPQPYQGLIALPLLQTAWIKQTGRRGLQHLLDHLPPILNRIVSSVMVYLLAGIMAISFIIFTPVMLVFGRLLPKTQNPAPVQKTCRNRISIRLPLAFLGGNIACLLLLNITGDSSLPPDPLRMESSLNWLLCGLLLTLPHQTIRAAANRKAVRGGITLLIASLVLLFAGWLLLLTA